MDDVKEEAEATPPTHTFGRDPKGVPPAGGRGRKAGRGAAWDPHLGARRVSEEGWSAEQGGVRLWLPREVHVAGEEYGEIRRGGRPLSPEEGDPNRKGRTTSRVAGPANPHLWQGPTRYAAGGRSRVGRQCGAPKRCDATEGCWVPQKSGH